MSPADLSASASLRGSTRLWVILLGNRKRCGIVLFFVLLFFGFWAITRVQLFPDGRIEIISPHVVSGDEPHYLLVLNSILFDHDLELQDDYERAAKGGLQAGGIVLPDHHTIIVNRRTGKHGLWMRFANGTFSQPQRNPEPELAPSPDVYEVSSHPVAFPALLAAFIAPFHPTIDKVQSEASFVVVVICWLGTVVTYFLGRQVGLGRGLALFAVGLLALASPWLAYTRSFFAEPVIGLSVAAALWAFEADLPVLAGLGAAAAVIFKPVFAVIGAGLVLDRIWERRWRDAVLMSAVLGACGLALMTFNYWLARTPIISGNVESWPLGSARAHDLRPLFDTFLGSRHGLFIWVPWAIFAIFPMGNALWSGDRCGSLLFDMSVPTSLYLAVLSSLEFSSGYCYGPRYWVPLLPWMAVAAVETIRSTGWGWRITLGLLAVIGVAIAIPGALRYPQMFSVSPWYLWHDSRLLKPTY
jgi:hypothetical protein